MKEVNEKGCLEEYIRLFAYVTGYILNELLTMFSLHFHYGVLLGTENILYKHSPLVRPPLSDGKNERLRNVSMCIYTTQKNDWNRHTEVHIHTKTKTTHSYNALQEESL
jgi:hypothetical protein